MRSANLTGKTGDLADFLFRKIEKDFDFFNCKIIKNIFRTIINLLVNKTT